MIDPEDIETNESIRLRLEEVERKLAQREKLTPHKHVTIRQQLITLVIRQVLPEDELVAEWLDLFTTHTYWSERNSVRPRNVSVSIVDAGNGELQVWGTSFTLKGSLKRKGGKVDEADRTRKQKAIQSILEGLVFQSEEDK